MITDARPMSAEELTKALQSLDIAPVELARAMTQYSPVGRKVQPTTVWRWTSGETPVPALLAMLVVALERMPREDRVELVYGSASRRMRAMREREEGGTSEC